MSAEDFRVLDPCELCRYRGDILLLKLPRKCTSLLVFPLTCHAIRLVGRFHPFPQIRLSSRDTHLFQSG